MKLKGTIKLLTIFRKAYWPYKKQIFYLAILGMLSGLSEGVGINAIIPLLSFVVGGAQQQYNDYISLSIKHFFDFLHIDFEIEFLLIFICFLFIIKTASSILINYVIIRIAANYEMSSRNNLFIKTIKSTWPHLIKQKLGHLENVITTDVKFATVVLQGIGGMMVTVTGLLIYFLVAFNISFKLTIISSMLGLIVLYLVKPLLKKTKLIAREAVNTNKQVAHFVNQSIVGMKTIKSLGAENGLNKIAFVLFKKLRDFRVKVFVYNNLGTSVFQPMSVILVSVIFIIYYKNGNFYLPAFLAIVYLIQKIFSYFVDLQSIFQKVVEAAPYLSSVLIYNHNAEKNHEDLETGVQWKFKNVFTLQNICFDYGSKEVLNNINFDIKKGEMVGIVGPSGSGKTTLVDLMLRLYVPTKGKIFVDGVDIKDINLKEWRSRIGYVSQEPFLLNDSIFNNISFYNEAVYEGGIQKAAQNAEVMEFASKMPAGLASSIGDRGTLISGGQKQRIAIARVLARQPEILILDEATSSLDSETESGIQDIIRSLKGNVTVIMIAHRLSTVMGCDKLVVIENGKVIEVGTPQSMMTDNKSYLFKNLNT